ncbi:MAG: hypothetical protein WKF30_01600 [Pyrinomonadaceae bacterium]
MIAVKLPHKLVSIMTDPPLGGESSHFLPSAGQQNRCVTDEKRDAHNSKENQPFTLAQTPPGRRHSLQRVVIAGADGQVMRMYFEAIIAPKEMAASQ